MYSQITATAKYVPCLPRGSFAPGASSRTSFASASAALRAQLCDASPLRICKFCMSVFQSYPFGKRHPAAHLESSQRGLLHFLLVRGTWDRTSPPSVKVKAREVVQRISALWTCKYHLGAPAGLGRIGVSFYYRFN